MLELEGRLQEAHGGRIAPVAVQAFGDGELHVEGAGRSLHLAARSLQLGPRAGDGSRPLQLDDGAVVAIAHSEDFERWIERHCGGGAGILSARTRQIARAAGSLALTVAIVVATLRLGVPLLASAVARGLPYSVDERLGAAAKRAFAGSLTPSTLSTSEQARVRALFERVAAYAHLTHPGRIELRGGGELGANAFALPGGAVLVTDELVALASSEDELAGVLAHELGHLHHRHGVRALLQATGIGLLATGALGDQGGGLIAAAPALLQLQYSRAFEREADAFARRTLREAQIDPAALARMLARLDAAAPGGAALPAYLSTHPATDERQRALEETE